MTTAGETAERAYVLRYRNGDDEPCAIVYARTARLARRQYRAIDGAEYMLVEAERRPEFDGGVPAAVELMAKHGWWFTCVHCGDHCRIHEDVDAPRPVVLDESTHPPSVACPACFAKHAPGDNAEALP